MNNTDEYLYHYTNIETLALILKHHTIRFNSLDKMDDLQEQEVADIKNIGQFCYISAWTDDVTESIPMWKMYSSTKAGVRIKLKKMPFKLHKTSAASLSKVTDIPITDSANGGVIESLIPYTDFFTKGFVCAGVTPENLLYKVEYTSDKNKLYPRLVSSDGKTINIALGELGKYKNTHWSFQHEWRYILTLLPININQSLEKMFNQVGTLNKDLILGLAKQAVPYYDMILDDDAFAKMEITLSPKISAGNRIIVDSLINKYNPSAIVKDSTLLGLI